MHIVNSNTSLFIAIFAVIYTVIIARKTARHQLDIYDLAMLSMVVIIPGIFAAFPQITYWISGLAGVEFPFILMFGMLIAILFIFIHRLTVKIHRLESDCRLLVQELSLLKQVIDTGGSK
jgi:hypothetical protein